jgi:type I restriction enzyme S subunit
VDVDVTESYKQITVRLHHRGVVLRGIQPGGSIGSTRQYRARAGQLILSRIDARNGAIGLVPDDLDGAIVTNDFWLFDVDDARILPKYLDYYVGTPSFVDLCKRASEGTTNRVRLQPDAFLRIPIPLPSLAKQRRIVARVEALAAMIEEARGLQKAIRSEERQLLGAVFQRIIEAASWKRMSEVAPLVRRTVEIDPSQEYHELGIRSFSKGTFHKPSVSSMTLGSKRVFRIEPGDLLFSNVFAWEGAVAVARPEDEGRIGSHRFITCVPKPGVATASFLRFHFSTSRGLHQLGEASPGGAGRNRTLGLQSLAQIEVPVPNFENQVWFDELQSGLSRVESLRAITQEELEALLPALLDRTFRWRL